LITHAQAQWWETGLILRWLIVLGAGLVYGVAGVYGVRIMEDYSPSITYTYFGVLVLPLFIIAIDRPLQRWFLAMIVIDISAQYDVYLMWDRTAGAVGAVGGFSFSLTTISLIGLYILWIVEMLVTRENPIKRPTVQYSLPFVAYIAVSGLSVLVASNVLYSLFELSMLVQMLLLFFYISGTVRSRDDVRFILVVMFAGLAFQGLFHVWERFGPGGDMGSVFREGDSVYHYRVNGTFSSPNVAGAYFSFFLTPALGLLLTKVESHWKALALFAFAAGTMGIFLTLSRGGWIAFGVSLGFFLGFMTLRGWISLSVPMILAVGAIVLMLIFPELLLARIFGSDGGAAIGRLPLNIIALNMAEEYPLFGVGLNNFAEVMDNYIPLDFANEWFYTVHNKYLLVLAETGPLGLAAMMWFLLLTLRRAWKVWRGAEDPFYAITALVFMSVLVGHMIHMNLDVFNYRPTVQMTWFIAALIAALYAMTLEDKELDDDAERSTT
jgi:O-antigen ligase